MPPVTMDDFNSYLSPFIGDQAKLALLLDYDGNSIFLFSVTNSFEFYPLYSSFSWFIALFKFRYIDTHLQTSRPRHHSIRDKENFGAAGKPKKCVCCHHLRKKCSQRKRHGWDRRYERIQCSLKYLLGNIPINGFIDVPIYVPINWII